MPILSLTECYCTCWACVHNINTLRSRQNGRHFADDIFKCIFLNKNVGISIRISMKFVPKCPINNIPALVQILAWHLPGDKPLSEPMMVKSWMHICVTLPQRVKQCLLCPMSVVPQSALVTVSEIGVRPHLVTHPIIHSGTRTHYNGVIMSAMASQITSLTIVY